MKKAVYCIMKAVSGIALVLAITSVNSACFYNCYQPEVPESAMKFKR